MRFRPGSNDSFGSFLFELSQYLQSRGEMDLAGYHNESHSAVDFALASRLALRGMGNLKLLIALDDYHVVDRQAPVLGLLEEMVARLPAVSIVTVSRHHAPDGFTGALFEIPPLTFSETHGLLERLLGKVERETAETLHRWTNGVPHLVKLAASWLRTTTADEFERGTAALNDRAEVQAFLLDNITELIDSDDRGILEAASVFRDRFTDDALAFVAETTRGEVNAASHRLVRLHIATRSREGDASFFHTSVRDYVYSHLRQARRSELHARAARWFSKRGDDDEHRFHREAGGLKEDA
jgi:ATP/maltotriose-dependent transcriptional regulator MalT